jgi:hypothetical protein
VRFAALQSFICTRPVDYLVLHVRLVLVVSDGKSGSYRVPSAACFHSRLHPLLSFTPLQSLRFSDASTLSRSTFLGVAVPSSRHQPVVFDTMGFRPTAFPSSAFLTPSTVCTTAGLVGLFHPTATSRVLPSGIFPLTQPLHLVGEAYPLVVGAVTLPPVARWCHVAASRPQGFAPYESPLLFAVV